MAWGVREGNVLSNRSGVFSFEEPAESQTYRGSVWHQNARSVAAFDGINRMSIKLKLLKNDRYGFFIRETAVFIAMNHKLCNIAIFYGISTAPASNECFSSALELQPIN